MPSHSTIAPRPEGRSLTCFSSPEPWYNSAVRFMISSFFLATSQRAELLLHQDDQCNQDHSRTPQVLHSESYRLPSYINLLNPIAVRGMSFFDSEFFDITANGKLEGHLLDYDHPPMSGDIIPFADNYDYYPEHLGVAETSMDLEAMIESNIGSVADYLSHSASYQPQPMVKREIAHLQEDEDSRCLPSTLTDANDYPSVMMPSPYDTGVSSPAGRSTTSSSASTSRRFKSGGKNVSKDSDEYKRRRTLNNIAVKKSREKAKAESRMVAQRVTVLSADKERLERRVEQLSKEIQFLHGLFSKFNDIPEPIKLQVTSVFARLQSHR